MRADSYFAARRLGFFTSCDPRFPPVDHTPHLPLCLTPQLARRYPPTAEISSGRGRRQADEARLSRWRCGEHVFRASSPPAVEVPHDRALAVVWLSGPAPTRPADPRI